MINLSNKKILITGASSGIGRACAILCSQLGAQVALVGRSEERLSETTQLMDGANHRFYSFDLSDLERIEPFIMRVIADFGALQGFVHSAGIQFTRPIRVMNPGKFHEILNLNVIAGFELVRALINKKGLVGSSASLIFLSSVSSLKGRKGLTGYSSSKGAIISGARSLAVELATKPIRVNCVSPGLVETKMMGEIFDNLTDEQKSDRLSDYPLGIGQPEDVANAVCFLLSDAARWITGTNLIVDGGYSCK
jgi:NAD(P)-dependent dehydrogenase (short-subunit alcohol dehydrogenase family)